MESAVPLRPRTLDIVQKSGLPWLRLDIDFPHEAMLAEARALRSRFVRVRYPGSRGYHQLCLHGLASDKVESYQHFGYAREEDAPFGWTDVAALCPVTTAFFRDVWPFARYTRIRFALVRPGGGLVLHRDYIEPHLGPSNFALNHPEGCVFRMPGIGDVPFTPGSAFMLDTSNRHEVQNDSREERIHVLCHGIWGAGMQALVERSFQRAGGRSAGSASHTEEATR